MCRIHISCFRTYISIAQCCVEGKCLCVFWFNFSVIYGIKSHILEWCVSCAFYIIINIFFINGIAVCKMRISLYLDWNNFLNNDRCTELQVCGLRRLWEKWTLFPGRCLIIFHWYDSDGILNHSDLNSAEHAMPQLNKSRGRNIKNKTQWGVLL